MVVFRYTVKYRIAEKFGRKFYLADSAEKLFFYNLVICSSTRIPNIRTRTRAEILADFSLAVCL